MSGSVLLVGSVPLESVEQVLRVSSRELGRFLTSYPDGELGERRDWILHLPRSVYSATSGLEEVHRPREGKFVQPGSDVSGQERDVDSQLWTFRVRDGAGSLSFGEMGYAAPARESYATFARLREAGEIPATARFQVTLPATGSGVMLFFEDAEDWPAANEAYRAAMRAELAQIMESVAPEDLVVQWDIAMEVRDLLAGDQPLLPWSPAETLEEKWARHLEDFGALSYELPEDVLLGYHFCFGTWGGWPHSPAPDMEVCTRLANAAVVRARRRVDYVHMPVMPDPDAAFFEPMRDLDIGETKAYLGLVLHDDLDAFDRRVALARRYLPDFGIASYCGWGRLDDTQTREMITKLRVSAERLDQL